MARIIAPNKEYAGVSAGVLFNGGEGYTDDAYLISWFREHGYYVEEPIEEPITEPIEEPIEELEDNTQEGTSETVEPIAPAQKKGRKKEG